MTSLTLPRRRSCAGRTTTSGSSRNGLVPTLLPDPDPPPASGFPILGPASALRATVEANLPTTTASLFRTQMLPEIWDAAVLYNIDPVGPVAQSGKETDWGYRSNTGNVKPEFYNTAGMKVRHVGQVIEILNGLKPVAEPGKVYGDHPLVHQQFPNWRMGALAQAQHLVRYTGGSVEPGFIVDPRYTLVGPPFVTTWAGLGGRWAPSLNYGIEIEAIMTRLQGG